MDVRQHPTKMGFCSGSPVCSDRKHWKFMVIERGHWRIRRDLQGWHSLRSSAC